MRPAAACVTALLVFALTLAAWSAYAVDRNFAGSAQVDYFFVPTSGGNLNEGGQPGHYGFDGFTLEASEKVAVDVSDHLSANVKVCFGCHGFELDMAYADYRFADELNVRAGRFSPSFGAFNLRHDVANHKLSDKPLPYDMGRMLRMRMWGLGVLPSPFPDNGVEIDGTHWFGESTQLDYAAYAVGGFRTAAGHPLDIDFALSHSVYYADNNAMPAGGGRLALTQKLGELSDVTIGASGMYGTYDPNNAYAYRIVGADVTLRVKLTAIRLEYLARRTDIDTSQPALLALPASTSPYIDKHGAYLEIEQPLTSALDLVLRTDGLLRIGNFATDPTGETFLSRRSWIARYTVGTNYAFERAFRLKLSTELWQFSDADDDGHTLALGVHVALVSAF